VSIRQTALRLYFYVATAGLSGAATAAGACTVSMGVPENPPFAAIEEGQVTGVVAEVTVLALRNMGCHIQPRRLPFARMYKWLHGGKLDVATAVRSSPDRAALAHYSVPIFSEYQLIMIPKNGSFTIQTLNDLEGKDIGGQLGFHYPRLMDGVANLMRARSFEININRLMRQRIDGTIIGSVTGPHMARRMGITELVAYLPKAVDITHLSSAIGKQALNHAMRHQFDKEIRTITKSRLWKEILAANNVPSRPRTWPLIEVVNRR
jgi:ABC-type amino acid transport substrate-binding protein